MKHLITDIQRFSLSDGPGIRTTVFFKGCNLRCAWCHNPETLAFEQDLMHYQNKCIMCGKCLTVCPVGAHKVDAGVHTVDRSKCTRCGACAQVCYAQALVMSGREMSVEEIMEELIQDKPYYEASGGGVTLSGGEVLCHVDFALALTKACKAAGIPVAVETNLSLPWEQVEPLLSQVDLVMADLKLWDTEEHKQATGMGNERILENLKKLQKPLILRTPLIPGITAKEENLRAIGNFAAGLPTLQYYELLNFNPLGGSKYESLDTGNAFAQAKPYSPEEMAAFVAMVSPLTDRVKAGG